MDAKRAGNLFIERSIRNALDFFKEAVFSEDIARRKLFLQSVDPRIKIALLMATLIGACLIRKIAPLLGLYILSIVLAASSGVGIIFFLKRVWLFIPLFTLFVAIPAALMQGPYAAGLFVLRVATCVSFTVAVVITTRHNELLKSLAFFGVSAIFIQVLDMTYRYIFLFIKIFEEMHTSLKARLVGRLEAGPTRHWAASRIAFLFRRSIRMSEEVHLAMLARGYDREE